MYVKYLLDEVNDQGCVKIFLHYFACFQNFSHCLLYRRAQRIAILSSLFTHVCFNRLLNAKLDVYAHEINGLLFNGLKVFS